MEDLEDAKRTEPDRDHSASIAQLTTSFQSLRVIINNSTIHADHQLRHDIVDYKTQLRRLSTEDRKASTPTTTMAHGPASSSRPRPVQLPKIALPTFEGDLMTWSTFWSQFKAAVDSNPDLSNSNILAYLRDSIRDPGTRSLLYSGVEHDGHYSEIVALLHQCFDKRRIIHATHCRTLADIGLVKTTRADLNQFADTIFHAVSGLTHTGQFQASPIVTSLLVSSLSKQLQVEWEIHTQDNKDVPDVEVFLTFLRLRADALAGQPNTKPPETKTEPTPHPKKYKAAVHTASPHSSNGPIGFRYECNLCPGERHPSFQCTKFNGMSISQRGDHLNRFDAISAYMRKMDRYGLSDFLKISHIR